MTDGTAFDNAIAEHDVIRVLILGHFMAPTNFCLAVNGYESATCSPDLMSN